MTTKYCDQSCGYKLPTEYADNETTCGACLNEFGNETACGNCGDEWAELDEKNNLCPECLEIYNEKENK